RVRPAPGHRLRTTGRVDDRQAPMPQPKAAIKMKSLFVRAAMCEGARHAPHESAINGRRIELQLAADSTHGRVSGILSSCYAFTEMSSPLGRVPARVEGVQWRQFGS